MTKIIIAKIMNGQARYVVDDYPNSTFVFPLEKGKQPSSYIDDLKLKIAARKEKDKESFDIKSQEGVEF